MIFLVAAFRSLSRAIFVATQDFHDKRPTYPTMAIQKVWEAKFLLPLFYCCNFIWRLEEPYLFSSSSLSLPCMFLCKFWFCMVAVKRNSFHGNKRSEMLFPYFFCKIMITRTLKRSNWFIKNNNNNKNKRHLDIRRLDLENARKISQIMPDVTI